MQDNSNISFRTLVIARSPYCGPPLLLDAGGFNAPQAYSTPPACSKGGAEVLGSCCGDCQAELIALPSCLFCSAKVRKQVKLTLFYDAQLDLKAIE